MAVSGLPGPHPAHLEEMLSCGGGLTENSGKENCPDTRAGMIGFPCGKRRLVSHHVQKTILGRLKSYFRVILGRFKGYSFNVKRNS